MVIIAALFLVLALVCFLLALRIRRQTGLPWVRIIASDTGTGHRLQQPLFSPRYGLTGKPDYLLKQGIYQVPVEVKPGRHATQPYESDLMQLAAYCLLVEEALEQAPPYGLLRYAETTFRLDYTPAVRSKLLALLDDMRETLEADDCARSHADPRRCRGCGFFEMCDEALVD